MRNVFPVIHDGFVELEENEGQLLEVLGARALLARVFSSGAGKLREDLTAAARCTRATSSTGRTKSARGFEVAYAT